MKKMLRLFVAAILLCITSFSQPYIDGRFQDVYADRGDGTGVIYFGSTGNRFLYFDGTNYHLANANLYIAGGNTALHAGNFNSYSPTLTGTGASGTWNINAAKWGGIGANFASSLNTIPHGMLGYAVGTDLAGIYTSEAVKSFLGIPSGGETLQSVTDRGNTTTNFLIGKSGIYTGQISGGEYVGNQMVIDYAPSLSAGRIFNFNSSTNVHSNVLICPYGGNIGIGNTSPAYKLDVSGNARFSSNINIGEHESDAPGSITRLAIQPYRHTGGPWLFNSRDEVANAYLDINYNTSSVFTIVHDGSIGIGTAHPQSKLAVNGTITSMRVKVTQTGWADYVFDSSYQLAPLHQVEKYIQVNKHLPDVPSAAEVKKEGLDLGDNQAVLLKKIEELTLYIIEQNKELKLLAKKVEKLETGR
jgi:hypothetical protein